MNQFFKKNILQKFVPQVFLCFILIVLLCFQGIFFIQYTFRNLKQIVSTTEEQRKGRTYASYGYDYITYISSIIPDPQIFPVTRYINYSHNVEMLLPINVVKTDGKVLIGINLPEEDTKEGVITTAHRSEKQSDGTKDYWAFNTIQDYDALTGFRFLMDDVRFVSPIKITLFNDASEEKILGSWIVEPDGKGNKDIVFTLPIKIKKFSFLRGSRDFIIVLEQMKNADVNILNHIEYIEVYGIKVNLEDYQIVHRSGRNFTALTHDFLRSIEKDDMKAWKQFLSQLEK